MQSRVVVLISVLAICAVACGDGVRSSTTTTGPQEHTVSGYAHSGPTCPVVITPPDPTCDDRPVVGALMIVRNGSGEVVAEARTAADGTFVVTLPPGSYTLVPQAVDGLMGTAAEASVIVIDRPVAGLDFAYDTGIR